MFKFIAITTQDTLSKESFARDAFIILPTISPHSSFTFLFFFSLIAIFEHSIKSSLLNTSKINIFELIYSTVLDNLLSKIRHH